LADGWTAESPEAPRELIARLRARWQANVDQEVAGVSTYCATFELTSVRLLGAMEMAWLLLGSGIDVAQAAKSFWEKRGGGGRLAVVVVPTPALKHLARQAVLEGRCVVLASGEVEALLTHPVELLKQHVRDQIPPLSLLPYDVTHPAPPNMFVGREDLLRRFHDERTTSFAVAGPARIGKSSLMKQYHYEVRRNPRDDRRFRMFLIDCYPYGCYAPDEFAQRLALDISADSEANRVNQHTLLRFLKRHSHDGRYPLELLLDEVDGVCLNPAFQELGEAVRWNYSRVIMCGRGNLHRMMRRRETQFAQRLELIQPEPLDETSAAHLLLDPLADMGLKVQAPDELRASAFALSGRRPNLLQAYARHLTEAVLADRTDTIAAQHLEKARQHLAATAYSTLPLHDLEDDPTRLVLLLLLRSGGGQVTVGSLQRLGEQHGLMLSAAKALDICFDLWICNVLLLERGVFVLSDQPLVDFVRRMDFSTEIARRKQALSAARQ
jgi:hypothetical protein